MGKFVLFGLFIIVIIIFIILIPNNTVQDVNNKVEIINTSDKNSGEENVKIEENSISKNDENNILHSTDDINLHDIHGEEKNYSFTYDGETYNAIYTADNWKINY